MSHRWMWIAPETTIRAAATNTAAQLPAVPATGRTIHQRIIELFMTALPHPHLHECRLQYRLQYRPQPGPRTDTWCRRIAPHDRIGNAISPDRGGQLTGHHAE